MRTRSIRRRLVSAASGIALVAGCGAATAFGSGSGAVHSEAGITISGTVAQGIGPGRARPVTFTAANSSGVPVKISQLQLANISADAEHAECDVSRLSMASVLQAHSVPAGATAERLPNKGLLVYAATNAGRDACQGATLTLTLTSI